ncbi:unnamed protein product [Albugo candida]|nr:unnamed protein product [Albugo candida]|eukprot:CCI40896.1 unnamed protein product [Albugo candida]
MNFICEDARVASEKIKREPGMVLPQSITSLTASNTINSLSNAHFINTPSPEISSNTNAHFINGHPNEKEETHVIKEEPSHCLIDHKKRAHSAMIEATHSENVFFDPSSKDVHVINPISDYECSEDDLEQKSWECFDFEPAVEMVNKVIGASIDAGKQYNKAILSKTSQLINGFDNVLLEIKSLSDARDRARKSTTTRKNTQESNCECEHALSLILSNRNAPKHPAETELKGNEAKSKRKPVEDESKGKVHEFMEEQTDRVLLRIEASMERLRELTEMVQSASLQGEASLIAKVRLEETALESMNNAIHSMTTNAAAKTIAQERARSSKAPVSRMYSSLQLKKMEDWYHLYPRPLSDELTLMRTILNYHPYANPFQVNGLTVAQIRDWFKRRRYRERMSYVRLAIEAGRDAVAAEEEVDFRIEQRIHELRKSVDPNELVNEVERVRMESSMYDSLVSTFTKADKMDSYIAASYGASTGSDHQPMLSGMGLPLTRVKRQRIQELDADESGTVKFATVQEIQAMQSRIRDLLTLPKDAINMNGVQQVIDILRSLEIPQEVRIQTNLVADLKSVLKTYRKPSLLRRSTIMLLENMGFIRRQSATCSTGKEVAEKTLLAPPPPASGNTMSRPPPAKRGEKGKVVRPMKFSMKQVVALEGWFQEKYKPTQNEMEGYLSHLNAPPLREEKQTVDFSMTQLRRWFNKRRCLRRPPFALMSDKEGLNSTKAIPVERTEPEGGECTGKSTAEENESEDNHSVDNGEDA